MVIVPAVVNLLMWIVYLASAFGCVYFFAPRFGGWGSLDNTGKSWAVACGFVCACAMYGLVTTTVLPL